MTQTEKNNSNNNIFLGPLLSVDRDAWHVQSMGSQAPDTTERLSYCRCSCSHTEPQPTPASPGGPSIPLGRSLDPLVGTVSAAYTLTWLNSFMYLPQNSLLLKLDQSQLWEHSLSTQIFHRCRIYQAAHRDWIHSLCNCVERFLFLLLAAPPLGLIFDFTLTLVCVAPSGP